MKKILAYSAVLAPIAIIWISWGGFSNDMGTLVLSLAAAFGRTVVGDKMHENRAKAEEEKK